MEPIGPTGITWQPSRRPQETVVRQVTARLATQVSTWPTAPEAAADAGSRGRSGETAAFMLTLLLVVLVVIAGAPLAARVLEPVGCAPIIYTFVGSPPDPVRGELGLALEELQLRTGLVFEHGDPRTSSLQITWSDRGVTRVASSIAANGDTVRHLGFGGGIWQNTPGGQRLVSGTIEIDATLQWHFGLDRGDGLAAVFVHELGHVVGLRHSPINGSFMYHKALPQMPRWTPDELDRLAEVGRRAGCRPPSTGAAEVADA